ncbi:MAG: 3-deoxy-D-manno-octulosonic acid transferase, partial [Pseudomonadota bacterium]
KPEAFELQAQAARAAGLHVALRSSMPDDLAGVDMLVVDAIGEMGVWFRAADLVFMGFSLPASGSPLTGKNPFEALALGAAVIHGPDVTNFAESYEALDAEGATRQVSSVGELAHLIANRNGLPAMQVAAESWLADARRPLERTKQTILETLRETET